MEDWWSGATTQTDTSWELNYAVDSWVCESIKKKKKTVSELSYLIILSSTGAVKNIIKHK